MTIQIAIQEIFTLIKCHTKEKSSETADGYIKLKLCQHTQSYFSVFHSNPVHFDNIFFFCKKYLSCSNDKLRQNCYGRAVPRPQSSRNFGSICSMRQY